MSNIKTFLNTWITKIANYFSFSGFLVPTADAEASIREGISFRGTNILILIFAILIASLGLNTNSSAVIIGAMLISPLMGPIIGIGLAVGTEDFMLLKRSARNLLVAAGFSVLASTIYFLISPVSEGHSELLARTSPTIYDVLIGLFGGLAGIFAIASKNKGNVIPGVAIATALMPPLCTAGYGIATWQMNYFFGAFYLFLINSIYIALATFVGVKFMRFPRVQSTTPERAKKVRRIIYVVAILTLLPSIYLTYNMLRTERFQMNASRFVNTEFQFPATHVLSDRATWTKGQKTLTVTLIGQALPQDSLELAMTGKLQYYGLQGTKLNIVQGVSGPAQGHSVKEIYEIAQTTIMGQQHTIDSLRSVIGYSRHNDSIAARLAPELKVIFPQVADIAITRAVFGEISNGKLDTANIALVHYSAPMSQAKRDEFARYLEARLQVDTIRLVTCQP